MAPLSKRGHKMRRNIQLLSRKRDLVLFVGGRTIRPSDLIVTVAGIIAIRDLRLAYDGFLRSGLACRGALA